MHTVYHETMKGNPDRILTDLALAHQRVLTESKTLVYGSMLEPLMNKQLVALDTTDKVPGQICWALRKNSEFTEFFNYHLHQLFESGVYARTYRVSFAFEVMRTIP